MKESALSHYLMKSWVAKEMDFRRHEDVASLGTPDISFAAPGCHGWIELKSVPAPKRKTTVVHVEHFTRWQLDFLQKRGRAGGSCWVLLQVGRLKLLVHWSRADLIGKGELDFLRTAVATRVWPKGIDWVDFQTVLRSGSAS